LLIPVSDPEAVDKIKGAAPTLKGGDSL
jgi:hypothetical protein